MDLFDDASQIKRMTQKVVSFLSHVSSEETNLKRSTSTMAPTLIKSAMGSFSLDAKKQTQNSHWYQLNATGYGDYRYASVFAIGAVDLLGWVPRMIGEIKDNTTFCVLLLI